MDKKKPRSILRGLEGRRSSKKTVKFKEESVYAIRAEGRISWWQEKKRIEEIFDKLKIQEPVPQVRRRRRRLRRY